MSLKHLITGKKSIRARVAEVMEQRILDAEASHEEACAQIDAEAEKAKEQKALDLVNSVLGR